MAGGPDNDWVPSPMQWAAAAAEGVADTQAAQTRWKPSWDRDDDDDGDGAAGAGGEASAVDRAPLPTMALDSAAVYELPLQPSVTMPVVNNDDDGDGAALGAVEEGVGRGNPLPPLPRPQRALLGRAKGALEKAARSIL